MVKEIHAQETTNLAYVVRAGLRSLGEILRGVVLHTQAKKLSTWGEVYGKHNDASKSGPNSSIPSA
jgi:hypothetical protein